MLAYMRGVPEKTVQSFACDKFLTLCRKITCS